MAERISQELPAPGSNLNRLRSGTWPFGLCNAVMLFSFHRRAPFTALSCGCAAAWACRHVAGLDYSLSPM